MTTEQRIAYMVTLHREDTGIDFPSLALNLVGQFSRIEGYLNLHHMLHFSKGLFGLFEKILYI